MEWSKRIPLFIILLIFFQYSFGQNFSAERQLKIDELNLIIDNPQSHDTSLARAYIDLSELLVLSNIDTLISLSLKSKKIAETALKKSPKQQVKQHLLSCMADAYANIGYAYLNKGDIPKALKSYHKALKVLDKVDNKSILGSVFNNIGIIYKIQGDIPKAIDYWHKALKVREEAKDTRGIANSLYNLGGMYMIQKNPKKALEYFKKALVIQTEIGNREGIAYSLNSMGILHKNNGEMAKAIEYFNKSLKVREEIGDKGGVANSLNNIAHILLSNGKINEAFNYAQRGFTIAEEVGYPANIKSSAKLLSKIYAKQNNGIKTLEMYELYITMRDSLNNETTQKAAAKQQAKYEYEKLKVIDDKENEKQLAIASEQEKKQKVISYAIGGGLGLVIIFSIFIFNRLQITKKQKLIIEEQKFEVEIAHSQLEEKNKEITDSINYAKRIQSAILPPAKVVKEYLKESFILYKPKDIVAGDFYWLEQKEGKVLFAAADCTGHGVPGAMVSVVCNNALNRSVREYDLTDPGEILSKTRGIVVQEFEKSDEEVKDGMDIALCSLEGNTLKYAGAHNPLWIIRDKTIIETKANKQPIGKFDNPEPYTTHTFELQKGDAIYIFSDGFVDQFGGPKGKKFKTQSFRDLLLSVQEKPMEEQETLLDQEFETWRGNIEQIDDICVIGVKF